MLAVSVFLSKLLTIVDVSDILSLFDNIVAVSVFLNKLLSIVEVSDILSLLDNIEAVSVFLNKLLSIVEVSDILTFKLILPVKAAALSINDLFMVVESDLNFAVISVESENILVLKSVTLSPNALPAEDPNALILLDKNMVSDF
jgi:hypothetical protein